MKHIAVMADIHSNYPNFELVFNYINKNFPEVREYAFLGDYILNGFDGNRILHTIQTLPGIVLAGNKEEFFQQGITPMQYKLHQWRDLVFTDSLLTQENREYLKQLSNTKIVTIEGVTILFCHGFPYQSRGKVLENDYEKFDELIETYPSDVYFFAHTHRHFDISYHGKRFINVGSVGMPLRGERKADFGILTVNNGHFTYQSYHIPYDYEHLDTYFKESDYYRIVGNFAQISLMNLKDNIDYTDEVLKYIAKQAEEKKIDISHGIPNDLWDSSFEEFKKIRGLTRFV